MEKKSRENIMTYAMQGGLVLGLSLIGCMVSSCLAPILLPFAMIGGLFLFAFTISRYCNAFTMVEMEGEYSFGNYLMLGNLISFFSSMLVALATYLLIRLIGYDRFYEATEWAASTMEEVSKGDAQRQLAEAYRALTPVDVTFGAMWNVIFVGILTSLAVALFYKFKFQKSKSK